MMEVFTLSEKRNKKITSICMAGKAQIKGCRETMTGMAVACFLVIFVAAVVIVLLEMAREVIGVFIRS